MPPTQWNPSAGIGIQHLCHTVPSVVVPYNRATSLQTGKSIKGVRLNILGGVAAINKDKIEGFAQRAPIERGGIAIDLMYSRTSG